MRYLIHTTQMLKCLFQCSHSLETQEYGQSSGTYGIEPPKDTLTNKHHMSTGSWAFQLNILNSIVDNFRDLLDITRLPELNQVETRIMSKPQQRICYPGKVSQLYKTLKVSERWRLACLTHLRACMRVLISMLPATPDCCKHIVSMSFCSSSLSAITD